MNKTITPRTWLEDAICMIASDLNGLIKFSGPLEDMLDELETALNIGTLSENLDAFESDGWISSQQREQLEMLRKGILDNNELIWTLKSFETSKNWSEMRGIARNLKNDLNIKPYYESKTLVSRHSLPTGTLTDKLLKGKVL